MQTLANQLHTRVYGESDTGDIVRAVKRDLGGGELPGLATDATARPLAPYAMIAALVPLGLLLWRRNVR